MHSPRFCTAHRRCNNILQCSKSMRNEITYIMQYVHIRYKHKYTLRTYGIGANLYYISGYVCTYFENSKHHNYCSRIFLDFGKQKLFHVHNLSLSNSFFLVASNFSILCCSVTHWFDILWDEKIEISQLMNFLPGNLWMHILYLWLAKCVLWSAWKLNVVILPVACW